jgi:hypothetical protein
MLAHQCPLPNKTMSRYESSKKESFGRTNQKVSLFGLELPMRTGCLNWEKVKLIKKMILSSVQTQMVFLLKTCKRNRSLSRMLL